MTERSGTTGPVLGGPRRETPRARLIRAGFDELSRAAGCLTDPALTVLLPEAPDTAARAAQVPAGPTSPTGPLGRTEISSLVLSPAQEALVTEIGRTADPDLALLSLVRLAEACTGCEAESVLRGLLGGLAEVPAHDGPGTGGAGSVEASHAVAEHRARLLAVLGSSSALGDFLVAHPLHLAALAPDQAFHAPDRPSALETLTGAVRTCLGTDDGSDRPAPEERVTAATSAMRVAYRDRLLAIVADDLRAAEPLAHLPVVGQDMAELADASLEAGLLIARAAVGPEAVDVALTVIAMGKSGARELNYISDVDVLHVVGPAGDPTAEPEDEALLIAAGTAIATELAHATSATGEEPPLWPLDTALRPEGKDGALVRTLASHVAYYERWASSWEFQALLKARAAAGDAALGAAYEAAVAPFIWSASGRENFVDDARAMRRRVERESERKGQEDMRIKLGPGGLRDVEFTVQLLQLVHGRADESLHVRPTLEALDALSAGGYVSRADAAALGDCYKALRLLEHRSQLHRLRRTHELPTRTEDLRRIGRGIELRSLAEPEALLTVFRALRRQVRALHEAIYYRPLLSVAARLSDAEMSLSPRAARERLAAIGYLDPDGALRHIQALTEGVTRRAAIQRQLLPVIIGWIGEGPDPDQGLLAFRLLSESIGSSHWYLALLRDSPAAARRLCQVLSGARWTTERLAERPESIAWLDDAADLAPRPDGALADEVRSTLRRRALTATDAAGLEKQAAEAVRALMSVRTRELVRAALADSLDGVDPARAAHVLTDATDAVLAGVLSVATGLTIALRDGVGAVAQGPAADGTWRAALAEHAVIAMGRLGGREITYASDADVLFVHEARAGADEEAAAAEADAVARWTVRLMAGARPHPLEVDADLRPEGRQGPMSRSLSSYAEYYERWASVWERQALLRARACAGASDLGARFEALVAPLRWSEAGLDGAGLREIRRLKARMEAERLPRGTDPSRHLKLGPGGLSDVEWTAQVLQLAHAADEPGLRTTSTTEALRASVDAGLLTVDEGQDLLDAWRLASRVRAANVIGTGRDAGARVDVIPSDARDLRLVGRLLGQEPGHEREVVEDYRRSARHARAVVERVVFGDTLHDQDDTASARARGQQASAAGERGGGAPRRAPSRRTEISTEMSTGASSAGGAEIASTRSEQSGATPSRAATGGTPAGDGPDDTAAPAEHATGARRSTGTERRRSHRRGGGSGPFPWS